MKIGLDFHGVIDSSPLFFCCLSWRFVEDGHEVHIITGEEDTREFRKRLKGFMVKYTHLFSISSYHKSIGTKVWYDEKNTPWMDEDVWNKTKAWYCKENQIDLHIDDSEVFLQYFETPCILWRKAI